MEYVSGVIETVAVISDIHGDLPALEATLVADEVRRAGRPGEYAEKLVLAAWEKGAR